MRAYLAVIKDSFREALASRVLWILLILTTVLLLAVAPFSIREFRSTRFGANSVFDWSSLIRRMSQQAAEPASSPGKHIWSLFPDDLKQRLDATQQPEADPSVPPSAELVGQLAAQFNRLLGERGLYDEASWRDIDRDAEANELLGRGVNRLRDSDLARLNRLLLEAAFPEEIARNTSNEIYVAYFGWKLGQPLAVSRSQVTAFLKTVLAGVMNIFVGTLAVFAGILVTSPVMPHTFEAGAIDLLLSKPISRPLLFLAKYLGGCAFILLNAAYFVVGLWLIVGVRFDLWSARLLLCIPIFLFLFAIYYSVSAFAGVVWRNAIVSIVITVLFWAACFLVGNTKNIIELWFLRPRSLARIVPAGESLFASNEQGQILIWRESERQWDPVLRSNDESESVGAMMIAAPILGPVYDAQNDRLLAIKMPFPGGMRLSAEPVLLVGDRTLDWARQPAINPPRDPVAVFSITGESTVMVTKQSVFRLDGDPLRPREMKLLGLRVPLGGARRPFVAAGPEPALRLTPPMAAAADPDSGRIAIWNRGTLITLDRDEGRTYQRSLEHSYDGEAKSVALAIAGQTVVLATSEGQIRTIDARDGSVTNEFRPEGKNQPRFVEAAPGGRWFAVLFHNHRLWLWDAENQREVSAAFVGRGDISAAAFAGPNRLWLVDRGTRATEYELDPFRIVGQRVPEMGMLERVYRYGVLPIYTVFPKPGELDNMVGYLLTEQETAAVGPNAESLSAAQIKLNVRGPIWSSLAFTVAVLAITCLYVRRSDF